MEKIKEKLEDLYWLIGYLLFDTPFKWRDAASCGKKYCAYCGGDWFNYKTDEEKF